MGRNVEEDEWLTRLILCSYTVHLTVSCLGWPARVGAASLVRSHEAGSQLDPQLPRHQPALISWLDRPTPWNSSTPSPRSHAFESMEPTSIIDGLTGISVAGTALSRALFDLVGGLDDSPVDIVEIAQGLSDTSIAIRELRRVLRRNKQLCRNRLTRAVDSLMSQVEIVQDELFDIVRSSGPSLSRVISAFRRTKTTKLLEQVKTHKTTAQLMATTVALADREREHGETRFDITRLALKWGDEVH